MTPSRGPGDQCGHAGPVGVGEAPGQVVFLECDAGRDVAGRGSRGSLSLAASCPVTGRGLPGFLGGESPLWREFEDDVDGGLGDLPEPAEAGVGGQLPYRCGGAWAPSAVPPGWARAAEVHWKVDAA
jgi:hypothetical protein